MNINKFLSELELPSNRKTGKLRLKSTGDIVVEKLTYNLAQSGPDDAAGTISIDGDPMPAAGFIRNDDTYVLETAGGNGVEIIFTSSTGTFRCVLGDQAAAALKEPQE